MYLNLGVWRVAFHSWFELHFEWNTNRLLDILSIFIFQQRYKINCEVLTLIIEAP
jgi:hypothetical protein